MQHWKSEYLGRNFICNKTVYYWQLFCKKKMLFIKHLMIFNLLLWTRSLFLLGFLFPSFSSFRTQSKPVITNKALADVSFSTSLPIHFFEHITLLYIFDTTDCSESTKLLICGRSENPPHNCSFSRGVTNVLRRYVESLFAFQLASLSLHKSFELYLKLQSWKSLTGWRTFSSAVEPL